MIRIIIPTPSAHAVKPLWNESTNPSVIVAVNGLIGQNMKMQKWYILAGMGQLQMKMTNKSVEFNSQNILISRCIRRSYTKFGTKLASNASVATEAKPLISAKVEMRGFCLLRLCPNPRRTLKVCSENAGNFQPLRDFANR